MARIASRGTVTGTLLPTATGTMGSVLLQLIRDGFPAGTDQLPVPIFFGRKMVVASGVGSISEGSRGLFLLASSTIR